MVSESRNRYLLKNTLIFTLGNIGARMISFLLIPLYTNVLTKSQYGTVDLITTISTVAGPMLTLNIAESVMRFGLDKDADKEKKHTVWKYSFIYCNDNWTDFNSNMPTCHRSIRICDVCLFLCHFAIC